MDALLELNDLCSPWIWDAALLPVVFDICLHNLRPELHPQTPALDLVRSPEQTEWLSKIIFCFRIMSLSLLRNGPGHGAIRDLPELVTDHILSKVDDHIIPSICFVVGSYVLDDLQPNIPPFKEFLLNKKVTFHAACKVLGILMTNTRTSVLRQLQESQDLTRCMKKLTAAFMVHPVSPDINLDVLYTVLVGIWPGGVPRHVADEITGDHRFFTGLNSHLGLPSPRTMTEPEMRIFGAKLTWFTDNIIIKNRGRYLVNAVTKIPSIGGHLISLSTRILTRECYSGTSKPIDDFVRIQAATPLFNMLSTIMISGLDVHIESLLRQHLLQLLVIACIHWPRNTSEKDSFLDTVTKSFLGCLLPRARHHTILSVLVHAFDQCQCYDDGSERGRVWRESEFYKKW